MVKEQAGEPDRLAYQIGRQIASARHLKGWTQQRLADTAGVSQSSIRNWELGSTTPNVGLLVLLAQALGVNAGVWLDAAADAVEQESGPDT